MPGAFGGEVSVGSGLILLVASKAHSLQEQLVRMTKGLLNRNLSKSAAAGWRLAHCLQVSGGVIPHLLLLVPIHSGVEVRDGGNLADIDGNGLKQRSKGVEG